MTDPALKPQHRAHSGIVALLAPGSMSFLSVPLTPARAAKLADFCARKGVDPQALVIDLIDDLIFSSVVSASGGVVPCMEEYRSESPATPKSPDTNVGIPTELSELQNSEPLPRSYGLLPTPPRSSPPSEKSVSAPPNDGSQAKLHRPIPSSKPSTTRHSVDRSDACPSP